MKVLSRTPSVRSDTVPEPGGSITTVTGSRKVLTHASRLARVGGPLDEEASTSTMVPPA